MIRAAADGYTFLIAPTSFETANPFLFKQTINPAKELTPVAGVGRSQMYLVVKPQSTVKDAKEFVAYARANPGKLSYASSGSGTPPHLAGELFKRVTGVFATHIPYRGSGPALVDLVGGQVQLSFDTMPSVIGQVKNGRIKALAVASAKRNPQLPSKASSFRAGSKPPNIFPHRTKNK